MIQIENTLNFIPDPTIASMSVITIECIKVVLQIAAATPMDGCFVEFGVYKGGSAWHLARLAREQNRTLHLYDTFTGIPEASIHDGQHNIDDFADTNVASVMALIPNAIFHVGVFPETMTQIGNIAFAHIDCDQYSSCVAAIEHFFPRLIPGGIMLFDDYIVTSGVTKAVNDMFGNSTIYLTQQLKAYVVKL